MKRFLLAFCLLLGGFDTSFAQGGHSQSSDLSYNDVQLCTNAYNHLWFTFESVKSDHRGLPDAQAAIFTEEFPKVLDPDFHFELLNLPLPPDFNTVTSVTADGIPNLVELASSPEAISNYGEHHVATPFSVKLQSAANNGTRVYRLTTRDIDYTRDGTEEGGCTAYLSQKDLVCTVRDTSSGGRKAVLNSVVDNVVTSYTLPPPNCGLWIAAPITPYVP
jgi:hypothetical protein